MPYEPWPCDPRGHLRGSKGVLVTDPSLLLSGCLGTVHHTRLHLCCRRGGILYCAPACVSWLFLGAVFIAVADPCFGC